MPKKLVCPVCGTVIDKSDTESYTTTDRGSYDVLKVTFCPKGDAVHLDGDETKWYRTTSPLLEQQINMEHNSLKDLYQALVPDSNDTPAMYYQTAALNEIAQLRGKALKYDQIKSALEG